MTRTKTTNSTSDSLNDTMRQAAEGLKDTGTQAMEGAKSVVGSAMADLKAGASAKAEEMRGHGAEEGQRMASSLRDAAGQGGGGVQARVLETMANGVAAVSDQIAERDLSSILDDVTGFARRNPAVFIAGAAVAGIVLTRLAAQAGRSAQDRHYVRSDFGQSDVQAGDMGAGFEQGGMMDDPASPRGRSPAVGGNV